MKKEYISMDLNDLVPYENNPRRNDDAVPYVEESIKQVGYITPIVVDENNIILCGHTRLKALLHSGEKKADVLKVSGLTEEQKKKYRLLDNKTGERAEWDFDRLESEISEIDFNGFDFGLNSFQSIDWQNVEDLDETTYKEPEHEMLECPACHHVDRKIHFKKVDG